MGTFSRFLIVLFVPFAFATGCVHLHVPGDGHHEGRSQGLHQSKKECKAECMEEFHECKAYKKKGRGGASQCAHAKNACKSRC